MTATALQAIPVIRDEALPLFRQMLFDAFDACRRVPCSHYGVNEYAAPGATDALRSWAGDHGYELTERVEYGSPQLVVWLSNGSSIAVTNAVPTNEVAS